LYLMSDEYQIQITFWIFNWKLEADVFGIFCNRISAVDWVV
jgi:hypothetical protein